MTVDYSLMADLVSECMDKSSPDANLSLEVRADVRLCRAEDHGLIYCDYCIHLGRKYFCEKPRGDNS
jgi:hypothetical protein